MTNIKYLKDNGLLEAHKQFLRMCSEEYDAHDELMLNEAENESQMPNNEDPNQGGGPDMNNQNSPEGNDGSMGGGEAPMGGGEMPMGGTEDSNGGEAPMGGENDPMSGGEMPMGGDDSMGEMKDTPFGDGGETHGGDEGDDDDTIDIDDLTDAQEKINHKTNKIGIDLGKVDNRIERLMQSLEKMESMIDSNNSEIMNLRKEFEKRNPTQVERIDMRRRFDSPGFSESPEEAIEKRLQARNNYTVTDGGEKTDDQQYSLTQRDVDSASNSQIADSFYKIDDDDIQDINKIFGI